MVILIYLYLVLTAILLTIGGVLYIYGCVFNNIRFSYLGIGLTLLSVFVTSGLI